MTRGTTRAHIARAALEGIALQVTDVLEAMQADSGLPLAELRVDGGAAANNMLMQMQADVLGMSVVRPKNAERPRWARRILRGWLWGTGRIRKRLPDSGKWIACSSRRWSDTRNRSAKSWQ